MNEFDFDNIEVTDDEPDEFDFDLVFGLGETPEFDESILDEPIGDYGEDEEGDPSGGVLAPNRGPDNNRDGGTALKQPKKERELALVGS